MGRRIKRLDIYNDLFSRDPLSAKLLGDLFSKLDKDTLVTGVRNLDDSDKTSFFLSNPKYNELAEGGLIPNIEVCFRREADGSAHVASIHEFKEEGLTADGFKGSLEEQLKAHTGPWVIGVDPSEPKVCGCGVDGAGQGGKHLYYCDLFEKED